jgi:hypothetical protein
MWLATMDVSVICYFNAIGRPVPCVWRGPEGIALGHLPGVVIHWVHDTGDPGPRDGSLGSVQTLKLFKAPDSHGNLRGRAKKIQP